MSSHDAVVTSPISSRVPPHLSTRSPRSSLDSSPRTPNSPFLHNLSNRFRKSSSASNFSNGSEQPSQASDAVDKAAVAQSAKRFVLSVVRNDWQWPPPRPSTVSGSENFTEAENKQESILAQRQPVGWRTRFEGASDLDLDLSPVSGKKRSKRNSDPYKFESPDAIANVIQEQRHKRRRANAEEAKWNEGLRNWIEQRDAWTAAELHKPKTTSDSEVDEASPVAANKHTHHKNSHSSDESKHSELTPESPIMLVNGTREGFGRRGSTAVDSTDSNDADEDNILNGPYLPIYPPLFPSSHVLRARIKPAAYPTIYSKVVVQSLTPNVPIPLTHMIGALVDGWKAEGVWPPQTLVEQQTHALLKRAKGAQKGESAFQKWKRERDFERKHQIEAIGNGFGEHLVEEEEVKKGFRRSISGAVKKVFGIHPEVEPDGGLAKLGLKFGGTSEDDGLMKESRQVMEDNVLLNKALLKNMKAST